MNYYLGIDLGGTNVRVAKVSKEGKILDVKQNPSLAKESAETIFKNICDTIEELGTLEHCLGIGICVPGPVDQEKGWLNMATNIPALAKFPLVKRLEAFTNLPVYMDNDANVAGLAEALVGAGAGLPVVVYVTHSTGIGAGIIVNGQAVSGKHGYAGEVANLIIDPSAPKVNHLNVGALENLASGTALVHQAQQEIDPKIESGRELFELYKQGHPKAIEIIEQMSKDFAVGLSLIAHVVDPHVFVIGGGVSKSADIYFDKVKEYYNQHVHEGMKNVDIVLAQLAEPGIIGAAMLPVSHGK